MDNNFGFLCTMKYYAAAKKKKSRCTTKWVNFRNIMLGVDGKSQKTTYNLILFCEVHKQAKLNMNTVLVKHSHTSYKEFFLFV